MLTVNAVQAFFLAIVFFIITSLLHNHIIWEYLAFWFIGIYAALCGADLLNNWLVNRLSKDDTFRG